jgi:prolyl-tRNA editing enzyme YbaK/EbsC (Cys-tRNA(Pro) deacylase)
MDYHPLTNQITDQLTRANVWFETFTHEPVRTSEQAARTRPGYELKQGAKAILARVKKSETEKFFIMLVFPADKQFDKRKVKNYFHARDIRFATESEVAALTNGVEPGGVPPFGNLFGLRLVCDPTLFNNENIVFNAGDRSFSVSMRAQDYRHIVNPEVVDIIISEQ